MGFSKPRIGLNAIQLDVLRFFLLGCTPAQLAWVFSPCWVFSPLDHQEFSI